MTSIAITKITAAVNMRNELLNILKLKRSTTRPIRNMMWLYFSGQLI